MRADQDVFSQGILAQVEYQALPQDLLDAIPFGVLITDTELKLTQVNQWITIHIGRPIHQLLGKFIGEVFPEIAERKLVQAYRLVLQSHSALTLSTRIHRYLVKMPAAPDSGLVDMPQSAVIVPVLDDNIIHGTLTYLIDVTDRVVTEIALQHEVEKLTAIREIDQALSTLNLEACLKTILSWAEKLFKTQDAALFLLEEGELQPVRFDQDSPPPVMKTCAVKWVAEFQDRLLVADTHNDPRCDGDPSALIRSEMAVPILNDGVTIGVLTVQSRQPGAFTDNDLTLMEALAARGGVAIHNARLHNELELLAATDGLTGLANRRQFDSVLKYEWTRTQRFGRPLSLILIDLDNFKKYNDAFGHPVGDNLLKNAAQCMRTQMRASDTLARYGGEEFVCVLPETDLDQACRAAERLRQAVARLHQESSLAECPIPDHPITISLGVAQYSREFIAPADLIKAADTALYDAKSRGKNRFSIFPGEDLPSS